MATKTFKRMAGPAALSNAGSVKYTCPGATTAVVRHVHVQNPSGSAVTFTFSIGPSGTAGNRLWDAYSIPANSERSFWGPYTLVATNTLEAFGGTNNVLTLTVDGEEWT